MQENDVHLTKRHLILDLYFGKEAEIATLPNDPKWVNADKHPTKPLVMGKFKDGSMEKLYFCEQYPNWWYVYPGSRHAVVTKTLSEWAYLTPNNEEK